MLAIARRGRFAGGEPPQRGPRLNRSIRVPRVRVIGGDGTQFGIMETDEALRRAQDDGLDLVEVGPDERPPVCKIMDYSRHKFEKEKNLRKQRAASRSKPMKEIRLGRSVKIGEHDVKIRVAQARKFLLEGRKVLITQRFRGREMAHKDLGLERLRSVAEELSDIAKVESGPNWSGRAASILLVADRSKTS